jgi:hypothetical protein
MHRNEKYNGQTIKIDGQLYDHCEFTNCKIVYNGGVLPVLHKNQFSGCSFILGDAAERTMAFIKSIYGGGGQGGKDWVEDILKQIRAVP